MSVVFAVYVGFEHVPALYAQYKSDVAKKKTFKTFQEGMQDSMNRRVVSGKFSDWKNNYLWQGAYFSCGVWISLYLATAPRAHVKTQSD